MAESSAYSQFVTEIQYAGQCQSLIQVYCSWKCRLDYLVLQFLVEPAVAEGGGISAGGRLNLLGFCLFETCVGLFWPSIMKMRSQYLPEESRSTIMNFFRIPLNIFVCIVLYNVSEIKPLSLPCRLPLYVPNTPICRF